MFKSQVKLYVLHSLLDGEKSGYDLLTCKVSGKKPSPGYIYPLLKDLTDQGFVTCKTQGRRKLYTLTTKGKKLLKSLKDKHKNAMQSFVEEIKPLASPTEVKQWKKLQENMHNEAYKEDCILIKTLKAQLISIYAKAGPKRREKARAILKETLQKLKKV